MDPALPSTAAPPYLQRLTGWGRVPAVEAPVRAGEDLFRTARGAVLSRGLGRAYGDAALPVGGPVAVTTHADRILGFDSDSGVLHAEAGLSLSQLMKSFLPDRWFTPVSPGTQYVTLGGMVASDIHGKNHHVHGTICNFVRALHMAVPDGEDGALRRVRCTREELPDLFWATIGGMGLTGHVLEVELELERLPSPWIYEETTRHGSMEEVFQVLKEESRVWPMTVAWIDTSARGASMGRGIVMRGRWAEVDEAPKDAPVWRNAPEVPPVFPSGVMNRASVMALNTAWYMKHGSGRVKHVVGPEAFYYQLDMLTQWNRGYGARGFTQYQCVMPSDLEAYRTLLTRFQDLGGCSFVTVFKDCGPEGEGMLSFPKEGTSLAVDIPMGPHVPKLVEELNAMVIDHGGRVYLTKDAFTSPGDFRRMYPRLDAFLQAKRRYDPQGRISSLLAQRLEIG